MLIIILLLLLLSCFQCLILAITEANNQIFAPTITRPLAYEAQANNATIQEVMGHL